MQKTANLKSYDNKLKSIEKRRWQLWVLALSLLILFSFTISSLSYWMITIPQNMSQLMNMGVIRVSLVIMSLAFCIYIFEKELIFKRVSRRLINEKIKNEILDHEYKQVEALLNASKAINSVLDIDSALNTILKSAKSLLDADHASIMLYNDLTGKLEVANYIGIDGEVTGKEKIKVGKDIAGKVFKTGKPQVINGSKDLIVNSKKKNNSVMSVICIPLKTEEKVIGCISICVMRDEVRTFKKEDTKTMLIFAEQAAAAIEKARLFEKTSQTGENLLKLNEELQGKNKSLKKYILDLKQANTELEKFNNLIVNREIEMVRLKEKIKKLAK